MRVVIGQEYLSLNKKLAEESNKLVKVFNNEDYSKIEDISSLLLKRDISVEKKKRILIKKLHNSIVEAFSISKNRFGKKVFDSLKKRLHNTRSVIIKLRSINYYLETTFFEELNLSKIKIPNKTPKLRQQNALAEDELGALEYAAYNLIEDAVILDKRLLKEYVHAERYISKKERIKLKDLGLILKKESELLEHLEAKLPPPKYVSAALIKEPTFTHWTAGVFALLSYMEYIHAKEMMVFSQLKKNGLVRAKINKKIFHLIIFLKFH